ncbi:NUDIX hydrolase [Nocardioides sp. TF02-7]|uniref:NUDIX domain-containing protein n=1 Tax=Nocardioides sp. TF02-7 TaxID=2917724 RepID=UPI001F05E552|nr:NUDIX hydrolase [Nocardioides sp. TF02-7]UMG92291.1 NUDIX hydrolase [Nocardioides sp. TF02-7]
MHRFASVLLVDPEGRLLLQERDEHPLIDPGRWGFVGGHVDAGEDPDDAAYRELEEETGIRLAPPALPLWQEFRVFHAAYGTHDSVRVYVAPTDLGDDDVVVGEGRQIVFVDPDRATDLPLTQAAGQILPRFLASDRYRGAGVVSFAVHPVPADGAEDVVVATDGPDAGAVFTGTADGSVFRVSHDGRRIDRVAHTGGRPLGIEVAPRRPAPRLRRAARPALGRSPAAAGSRRSPTAWPATR